MFDRGVGRVSAAPVPLGEDEIVGRLAALPGWSRDGDEIARTFAHTYHECVHLAVYVAAKAREAGHHPDMHLTWQRIEFRITTHDAGRKLTEADFDLAAHIDAIAAAGGATPV
jgi:4a-hydroxytetrahydrobiopterin dehydratase